MRMAGGAYSSRTRRSITLRTFSSRIASSLGGGRDGETGSTFIAGSVDNLASVLSDYTQFSDKKLIDMGRAGRLWVEADYSLTRYRDRMLALYSDLGVCN